MIGVHELRVLVTCKLNIICSVVCSGNPDAEDSSVLNTKNILTKE